MIDPLGKLRSIWVIGRPVLVCLPVAALLIMSMAPLPAAADRASVLALTEYCRTFKGKVSLSPDKSILCYDGAVPFLMDLTPFHTLSDGGIFVVRSPGGNAVSSAKAANLLRDKQATVVIYDYCFSACANNFFVATHRTLVADNAIVAWHGGARPCHTGATDDPSYWQIPEVKDFCENYSFLQDFFATRGLDSDFTQRPQTRHTSATVEHALSTASDPESVFWMWHPANHRNFFRGVTYYRYPAHQAEVTSRLRALGLATEVIYDIPIRRYAADVAADPMATRTATLQGGWPRGSSNSVRR
jgi:hypothetical protein